MSALFFGIEAGRCATLRSTASFCPCARRAVLRCAPRPLAAAMATAYLSLFCVLTHTLLSSGGGVAPLLSLNDGRRVPQLGLGTWLGGGQAVDDKKVQEVERAVRWALDAGYRHIDTASIYGTEEAVGRAISDTLKKGNIKREDLFITTKLWNDHHAEDEVVPALRQSLKKLGLDYVDLYLIHWPFAIWTNGTFDTRDFVETWRGMEAARRAGLTRSIGLSNFNQRQIERVLSAAKIKPAMLQIEVNLNLQQPQLLEYCRRNNIVVTAYTPFGSLFPSRAALQAPPPRVDDPLLVQIASNHNKTVPQVVLRYLVELGVVPIPKSVTKERIEQNIDIFDFKLTPQEHNFFKVFDKNYHSIDPKFWKSHPDYPFETKAA